MKKVFLSIFLVALALHAVCAEGEQAGGKGEYTIAGIVFQADLYMRTVQIGMEAAAKKLGVTVLLGNSDNKVDKEARLIDTYIARGVDAIAITPIGNKGGSDAALQRAADAGIKIVYFNTKANVPSIGFVGTSDASVGATSGKAARAFIEKKFKGQQVKVATVSFRAQLPESAEARSSGFFNEIKTIQGVTLVAEQDAWLAEMAVRVVGDMITANPNIQIIHAANEGSTVGAAQAVRNAGKQGKIFVFGTDGSDQIAQMLLSDDNVLQAAAAQEPFQVGSKAVEIAVKALKGQSFEKNVNIAPRLLSRENAKDVKKFQQEIKSY